MCIRVPYSVSCIIVAAVCIIEHISAIFFARNGLHRNTTEMLNCSVYERTRLKCERSKEFFFLYHNSEATVDSVESNSDSLDTDKNGETPMPSENITSVEIQNIHFGNTFFMMPMYMSITNLYHVVVIVHCFMVGVEVLDICVIKFLTNNRPIKEVFLGVWIIMYCLFTIFEAILITICWASPEKCRRCVSDGTHPDMLQVWDINCAIDLIFQLLKGVTYILLHFLYMRKLKDLAAREILFAYELEYLEQLKLVRELRQSPGKRSHKHYNATNSLNQRTNEGKENTDHYPSTLR